jgi:hypothetical protein
LLLGPLEPADHLPDLSGHSSSSGPPATPLSRHAQAKPLEALTPEPKTIIHTAEDHIGTGRDHQAQLEEAMGATRRWLVAEDAVNSIGP